MKLTGLTISKIHQGLRERQFSAVELTQAYLNKIKSEDEKIGAFLTVAEQSAKEEARLVDNLIAQGKEIPVLAGVPAAIKDIILVKGLKCTAGSRILENYTAVYDAAVVRKLRKAGAVFLGKANMDEFAMGSSTEHSAFKVTRNPKDLERVPGGSSGGSAAAVAADEACFALGSDTGGSIRQPAAFCGAVGLKPTYGAVSRYGLIAFASSLDQIGPITKNVEDAEIVFDVIKNWDEKDSTSVKLNSKSETLNPKQTQNSKLKTQNLRIGVPKEYFGEGIDKEVREVIEKTIKKVEKEGAKIEEISLPHTKYSTACYYLIAPSEASSNLARYDGMRYGNSKFQIQNLVDEYLKTRGEGFGAEVKRRIMLGTYALSAGYYNEYYLKAQKVRTKILQDFQKAFQRVDFIFTPVSPTLPFKIGEKTEDPLKMYLSDVFVNPVNLAGLPAISLPAGEAKGLPVGLQIIGKAFGEKEIFQAGKLVESLI